MNRIAYVASALALALGACRGGGDDTSSGDDTVTPDSPPIGGEVTIQQVQDDAMPVGTQIVLRGVVVTAIDTYPQFGGLWVGEPEGGPFSGVKVFGANVADVALLQVGDLVDITNAIKHEACTAAAPCGSVVFDDGASITEVEGVSANSLQITKVGTGTVPPASTVDALELANLASDAERNAEWEKWEGVRIKVVNARQLDADKTFGDGGVDQHEFHITGGATVETVMAPFHADAVPGVCFSGITGIGDFFFDYLVLPENQEATAGGGTGCAALPVATAATIAEVQAGTKTGLVELNDVYVAAVNKKNIWISQSLTANANEGVYVFRSSVGSTTVADLPADVVVGAKVKVVGTVQEFASGGGDTLTEISGNPTITVVAAPTGTVAPVTGQSVSSLLAAATGEPYEGVLVTLTNVKVVTSTDNKGMPDYGVSSLAAYPGNIAFKADDDLFLLGAAATGKCYATITGIWSYSVYDDAYLFLPTAAGVETGGNCN